MGTLYRGKTTPQSIGESIRLTRKKLGYTQRAVADLAGTGLRFIIELEQGKPTCQLQKTLDVLTILGIRLQVTPPKLGSDTDES